MVFLSVAVGEPPLCMSCSVLFAVKRAVEEVRKEAGQSEVLILGEYCVGVTCWCSSYRDHVLNWF